MTAHTNEPAEASPSRYRVRLPGFVRDQDVGLGDAVSRVTARFASGRAAGAGAAPRRSTAGSDSMAGHADPQRRRPTQINRKALEDMSWNPPT